jgi:hypothetical protein
MTNYPHRAGPRLRSPLSLARLLEFAAATLVFIFAFTLLTPAQTISTQTQTDAPAATEGIEKGWNEFGIWGGISFNAPTLIGKTADARFGNVGLRYGRVLAAGKTVAFEYTIDAIPVALLSTKRFTLVTISPGVFSVQETRERVYGAGLAPIGLKLNFRRHKRLQPFAGATGGFLFFQRDVPAPGAAQFNFTFDFAGGVQIINSNRRAFTIGYKYQHISNGYRSSFNPGVDVQMIYAGFSVFR